MFSHTRAKFWKQQPQCATNLISVTDHSHCPSRSHPRGFLSGVRVATISLFLALWVCGTDYLLSGFSVLSWKPTCVNVGLLSSHWPKPSVFTPDQPAGPLIRDWVFDRVRDCGEEEKSIRINIEPVWKEEAIRIKQSFS